jgi:nucleotide-binding universal stress UspA family protein
MITLERILCPTDLSEDAERTLRYAVALARASGAKLFICHRPKSQADEEEVLQQIKELVATGETAPGSDGNNVAPIAWESFLLDGSDLGTVITRAAELRQADLILMRSRRRPFAAALLGSTAEVVARVAPCPVLVMHADEREWIESATGAVSIRRVLVAHDFSRYSHLALQYALNLVQMYQAELHLLHVLPPPIIDGPEIAWVGDKTNTPYHQAARRLQEAVSGEVHLWSNVKHAVQYGQPYGEILAYAETNEIDLISMGAHGTGFGIHTLFGSNVDRVLRQTRCPVLIAHPLYQAENKSASA